MYRVTATSLHLRSKPVVAASTRVAVLPNGHPVQRIVPFDDGPWWHVRTILHGAQVEGYVHAGYLEPQGEGATGRPVAIVDSLPEAHLPTTSPVTRASGRRAFPLNEPNPPRRTSNTPAGKADDLHAIVHWLAVESSARYAPRNGLTYCNIYAHDYCLLANAYLPRVWWRASAIAALLRGEQVAPRYDVTVDEVNANALHDWLAEFGAAFGWRRLMDIDALQAAANEGRVCVIVGKRRDVNLSGHICMVVPETATQRATRDTANRVTLPLQSQAGANNYRYGGSTWWTSTKFRSFAYWVHE